MTGVSDRGTVRGAKIELRNLTKRFGATAAVEDISLDVPAGAFVSLLGPSGSGKTTTLNLIAGFLAADAGDILFDDRSVSDIPPHHRDIGMVFQSYALFPHLTVADNVAFPLRMRTKLSRSGMDQRVAETLALVRMEDFGARYPRQLSGGQQQRVAMARALVSHPRLLLMDEPLGALDKKLREQMQFEIKRIHRSVGTTFVYVTHDQTEALTMSDLVVLMHRGRIAQTGAPRELYTNPANVFVADFIGDSNLLGGRVTALAGDTLTVALDVGGAVAARRRGGGPAAATGARVALVLRPEDISVQVPGATADMRPHLSGKVAELGYQGDSYRLSVTVGGEAIKAKVLPHLAHAFQPGMAVELSWDRDAASVLSIDGDDTGSKPA
jgi:putative spermidine/putrescine transport system ATP-binding protein